MLPAGQPIKFLITCILQTSNLELAVFRILWHLTAESWLGNAILGVPVVQGRLAVNSVSGGQAQHEAIRLLDEALSNKIGASTMHEF
jgi:hypothetical protein